MANQSEEVQWSSTSSEEGDLLHTDATWGCDTPSHITEPDEVPLVYEGAVIGRRCEFPVLLTGCRTDVLLQMSCKATSRLALPRRVFALLTARQV